MTNTQNTNGIKAQEIANKLTKIADSIWREELRIERATQNLKDAEELFSQNEIANESFEIWKSKFTAQLEEAKKAIEVLKEEWNNTIVTIQ